MARRHEDEAFVALERHRSSEAIKRMVDLLLARVETHRDLLEIEESEVTRGRVKECRALIKLLTE